jgi:hypothetical protein
MRMNNRKELTMSGWDAWLTYAYDRHASWLVIAMDAMDAMNKVYHSK